MVRFLLLSLAVLGSSCFAGEPETVNPNFAKPREDLPGLKNFAKVSDILYRGEQPTKEGFAELKKMGVKTVVNLRSFNSDRDEMKGLGLQYVHIYCKAWHPEDEDVVKFLQVMRDPKNHPVFIHCMHGADRTGMMNAVYRIYHQGWKNEEAAKELHNFGFHTLWTDIVKYLNKFDREKIEKEIQKAKPVKIQVVD
jgi:protein tyrosine/serine phosphatase